MCCFYTPFIFFTSFSFKAILNKKNWGVKSIKAWKDKLPKEVVDRLRKMASKEREMRGF